MVDKLGVSKDSIIKMAISVAILISIIGTIYLLLFRDNTETKEKVVVEVDSEILSTNPKETAANYIAANGNMGNVEEDLTEDKIVTGEHVMDNEKRRLDALEKVQEATIPGSELISGKERNKSIKFTQDSIFPYLYRVENISVSEPINERNITVTSEVGPSEYEAVDVLVSFDSIKTMLTCPTDVSYDGTHTLIENRESFDEIKATLVKSGDFWFMLDIEDSEKLLNERFATWEGVSNRTIDVDKDEEVGEIKIKYENN